MTCTELDARPAPARRGEGARAVCLLIGALVAGVAVVALGAAPAQAETWRAQDVRGDVRSYRIDVDTACETIPDGDPRPTDRRRDITRLAVRHGADDVVITMALRDVARHDRVTLYQAYVRTPGHTFDVLVDRSPRQPAVSLSTVRVARDPECGPALVGGAVVDCDGLVADIEPIAGLARITIPRACLQTPRWVRVAAMAGGYDRDQLGAGGSHVDITADVWGPAGTLLPELLPPAGPRVRAG